MPRRILLVVADYPDARQLVFDVLFSPRNKAYCAHHGWEYMVSKGDDFRRQKNWCKVKIAERMIRRGELKDGDSIAVMDADMIIANGLQPFVTRKSMAYAVDSCNSHCTGFFILNVNDWTRSCLDRWLDEDLYWRHCDEPRWRAWCEQAAWYHIAGIDAWEATPCLALPDLGWHRQGGPDVCMTLDELHEHVEVRGAEWGATLLDEEFDNPGALALQSRYLNRVRKEDVIIRHFCGSQRWRHEYAFRRLFPSPENPNVSLFPKEEPVYDTAKLPALALQPGPGVQMTGSPQTAPVAPPSAAPVPSGLNVTFRRPG
jgi:hypothetical protein